MVVEFYFRPREAWDTIWFWHLVYFVLWTSLPLLLCVRLRRILPASVIVAFLFGIEDTMFYFLQMRSPSPVYLGVAILGIWEPTLQTGLALNLLGFIMIGMVMRIDAYWATHFRSRAMKPLAHQQEESISRRDDD
jgi:hypothetical protein